jgi:hypothetical protein
LRFPPGGSREARESYQGRPEDEFLDDPQTHIPNRPPPGFDLEFQRDPRR